jgi:sugar-specific transcriptional regulator TrmB
MKNHIIQAEEFLHFLKLMGLTLYEAKVYYTLLSSQKFLTPREIYKEAGIPQPRLYDTLESLQKKGFISSTPEGTFIPLQLSGLITNEKISKLYEEKEAKIKDLVAKLDEAQRDLHLLSKSTSFLQVDATFQKPAFMVREKKEGVKMLQMLFKSSTKIVRGISKNPPLILWPPDPIFDEILKAISRGVKYNHLISIDYLLGQGLKNAETDIKCGIKLRVLPDDCIPWVFYAADDDEALVRIFPDSIILINEVNTIKALITIADLLWGKGLEIENVIKALRMEETFPSDLSAKERKICGVLLEHGRCTIDEIVKKTNFSYSDSLAILNDLCQKKAIEFVTDLGRYKLASEHICRILSMKGVL